MGKLTGYSCVLSVFIVSVISMPNHEQEHRREVIRDCIEQAFEDSLADVNCSDPCPFGSQENFCDNSNSSQECRPFICNLNGSVNHLCNNNTRNLCIMLIQNAIQSPPMDAMSEERKVLRIRNNRNSLEVDQVAEGVSNVLASVSMRKGMLTEESARGLFETFDGIFDPEFRPNWKRRMKGSTQQVFDNVDMVTSQIGKEFMRGNRSKTFFHSGNNLVTRVERLRANRTSRKSKYKFPTETVMESSTLATQASVQIPYEALCDDMDDLDSNCSVVVGVSIIDNFAEYLLESIQNSSNTSDTRYPGAVLLSAHVFDSDNYIERLREHPLELSFVPIDPITDDANYIIEGVFLNTTTFNWSSDGLSNVTLDNGVIKVTSNHLTSFSVLVSLRPQDDDSATQENSTDSDSSIEEKALTVVSYIGCGVSIVSLTLTIVILLVLKKRLKKGVLLYIHLNLSIALLLALIVFVAGLETATINSVLCTIVAALIQYLFLCVFCWMLCEGIMVYLLVVRVFGNLAKKWYLLLILGWGFPFPIVALSSGILHKQYGTQTYCWIKADSSEAAIWTFIVPMLIVIIINAVVLVVTVRAIVRGKKLGGAELNVTKMELARSAVKGSVVLLPLLGVTWVFGLFAVNSNTTVFAWLFTICNSLQGFFIFFFHVLRNEVFLTVVKSGFSKVSQHITGVVTTSFTNQSKVSAKTDLNSYSAKSLKGGYSPEPSAANSEAAFNSEAAATNTSNKPLPQ